MSHPPVFQWQVIWLLKVHTHPGPCTGGLLEGGYVPKFPLGNSNSPHVTKGFQKRGLSMPPFSSSKVHNKQRCGTLVLGICSKDSSSPERPSGTGRWACPSQTMPGWCREIWRAWCSPSGRRCAPACPPPCQPDRLLCGTACWRPGEFKITVKGWKLVPGCLVSPRHTGAHFKVYLWGERTGQNFYEANMSS